MNKVILLRHAECLSANLLDEDRIIEDENNLLTEAGKRQAEEAAHFFRTELFKSTPKIYSSPTKRAEQTAEIIADILNTSIEYFDELKEREFNFPVNFTANQSKSHQEKAHMNPHTKILDGESIAEHRARCVKWKFNYLDNITSDILIVSHGGTIEQLFGAVVGSKVDNASKYFVSLDYCRYHQFTVQCAGINTDSIWRVDKINA